MNLETFQYPEGTHVGGMMMLSDQDEMQLALRKAAAIMEAEPEFTPSFTQFANVVVNTGEEDAAFSKRCTDHLPEGDHIFDFAVFAYSVLTIKRVGWDGYLKLLAERKTDHDWPAPAISLL